MGLRHPESLRSFAKELASDAPSPGGGTAAAASGAFAAALLRMVCQISAKSKKRKEHAAELLKMASMAEKKMQVLLRLAEEDADSYDLVVDAVRRSRAKNDSASKTKLVKALKGASEVPLRTARECAEVLEISAVVAKLGVKSASSDVGVAVLLAEAGARGAAMNVRINLEGIDDARYRARCEKELTRMESRSDRLARTVLSRLR